jgi:8-oxo-dGTP pyrophosphatase MutT (NUDIX family)
MEGVPTRPRKASTVVLVRQHHEALQVYLLKRSPRSSFMPGNYVFPGGTIDPEDQEPDLWGAHTDLTPQEMTRRLGGGLSEEDLLAHGVAAVRETFEEAGVFLVNGHTDEDEGMRLLCRQRSKERPPKGWLRRWLTTRGATLALSLLGRWSHWITPEPRRQRFDTRFFLAFPPPGQECTPDNRETVHGLWIRPEQALLGNLRGDIPLSPPALVTLHELLTYSDIGKIGRDLNTRPWGEARLPRLVPLTDGALILLPWDPMYHTLYQAEFKVSNKDVLAPGEPFSRLWYQDGIWHPVGR